MDIERTSESTPRNHRQDGRQSDESRPVKLDRGCLDFADGSCLIEVGRTRVLCTASVADRVPPFLEDTGHGWVTAEYNMLPNSTPTRISRDRARGGRSQEIQRLIGRSLRGIMDLGCMGEYTVMVDCDVIQADGGTRTASITGAVIALHDALLVLKEQGDLQAWPMRELVAAISVGLGPNGPLLDLDYKEDSSADADFNMVMTESGQFIEFQGTAERGTFAESQVAEVLRLGRKGIKELIALQEDILREQSPLNST